MPTSCGARPGWITPASWIRHRPMLFSASGMGWREHKLWPSGCVSGWHSLGRADMPHESLTRYAWLSIAAAILTIALKSSAYAITGSVGLLSDALESLVNLVAAVMALAMLTIAARPPDAEHAYGHEKAEYFSSGVEGALIVVAAISIFATSVPRLLNPQPIEQAGLGLAVSVVAS